MIKATMKSGREVCCMLTEDFNHRSKCWSMGYFVQVCWTELYDVFYEFYIKPSDCDCYDHAAIERYVKNVVAKLDENDFYP